MSNSFTFTVDTQPMAKEMSSISKHVDGTTTAVAAMETAVVIAQRQAADHVCDKVNLGFYTLIHSQISQKMARLKAQVDSVLLKLNAMARQLESIQHQMERDYAGVCQRYTKTFYSLDRALRNRIYEVDKPAVRLAVKQVSAMTNRGNSLTATVNVGQKEALTLSQRILASNLKHRANELLGIMKAFLAQSKEQEVLTSRILLPSAMHEPESVKMVPVAFVRSVTGAGAQRQDVYVPKLGMGKHIEQEISNAVTDSDMPAQEREINLTRQVVEEYNGLMSNSSAPKRVKDTMNRLFRPGAVINS